MDVELDVATAIAGEANDLLHPCPDLVVAVLGLRELQEQAVHALNLVLDELHVATDAAEQLRLLDQDAGEAAQEGVEGALRVHLIIYLTTHLWISVWCCGGEDYIILEDASFCGCKQVRGS